jgi:CRISPR-associated endonuclease Csn1
MNRIIGLDLGTNSIGWAIRDTSEKDNQIIDKGVLTFDKGVGEGKSGEFPLVQKRTESRGKRRNYQAEKYRKWELLEFLIEQEMCPLSIQELDEWRKYKKGIGRKYPQTEKFIQWLRFDFNGDGKPDFELFGYSKHESYYVFRMLAISETEQHKKKFQGHPALLGRVLYQMVQRRGYRGRDDEDEEAKTILKGSLKTGTSGVDQITPYIQKYKTLGAALYHFQKETKERIRKRYNLRTDYDQELKEICRVQNLDKSAYRRLAKAIIWQRPLRSQKGLVGICTFENNKSRCPISHPLYEEFRTWVFINNLKITLPEEVNKLKYIKENVYPQFYNLSRDFQLSNIAKVLDKKGGVIKAKFAHGEKDEKGKYKKNGADTKVISCALLKIFENLFGDDWKEKYGWQETLQNQPKNCNYSFEDIWHILFTFDSKEKLREFAVYKLELNDFNAEKFSKIKLQAGYATLSLSAIKKILPYLYQGFVYSEAVYLANLHKVLGETEVSLELAETFSGIIREVIKEYNDEKQLANVLNSLISDQLNSDHRFGMEASYKLDADDKNDIQTKLRNVFGVKTWNEILSEEEKQNKYAFVEQKYLSFLQKPITAKKEDLFIKSGRLHDEIFKHLQDIYNVPDINKRHLWHPSEQEIYLNAQEIKGMKALGDPRPISNGFKNPMALRTLHELKKLINYLLQTGKIDQDTRIVVEIARELNDANMRKAIEKYQRDREKENDEYKKKIKEISDEYKLDLDLASKDIVDKYRLWLEQGQTCLYTGKIINCKDLFDGSKYNFEHTIPASMSFDNELKNLTIADIGYNMNIKKNKIPFECPNYDKLVTLNGAEYTPIEPRLTYMTEKAENLSNLLEDWVNKTKFAPTKEMKDNCIQRRHILKMELNYWRKKLDTFTCKEYKSGWRNSQLKDTQIVTKYALPYLKTIFERVEVQKGSVTAAFREIFKIQPRLEKKARSKHSHHAIDAAVLTLIPSSAMRDKILLRYNEEKDKNANTTTYHEKPRNWANFETYFILSIEDEVLNNFQARHRTLIVTKKNVRKRGKQQFVKYKDEKGKFQYKTDKEGDKIPLIAQGDTIRGQLHEESFMSLIKQPEYLLINGKYTPKTDGKGNFVFQKREGADELFVVKKIDLIELDSVDKFKKIIDPNLRDYLTKIIEGRLQSGKSFQAALLEPIWAYGKKIDKNGDSISPIRHIRCQVAKAAGFLTKEKTLDIRKNASGSKYPHKRDVLAGNAEMTHCLYYEDGNNRAFKLISRFELSLLKIKCDNDFYNQNEYNQILKGAKKTRLPLSYIIQQGSKVFILDEKVADIDDLKKLNKKEYLKRLFIINNFNIPAGNTVYIYLINHIDARGKDILQKVEEKNIDTTKYQAKLALTADKFTCAIEGKHFLVKPDGQIKWLI